MALLCYISSMKNIEIFWKKIDCLPRYEFYIWASGPQWLSVWSYSRELEEAESLGEFATQRQPYPEKQEVAWPYLRGSRNQTGGGTFNYPVPHTLHTILLTTASFRRSFQRVTNCKGPHTIRAANAGSTKERLAEKGKRQSWCKEHPYAALLTVFSRCSQ